MLCMLGVWQGWQVNTFYILLVRYTRKVISIKQTSKKKKQNLKFMKNISNMYVTGTRVKMAISFIIQFYKIASGNMT